MAEAPLFGSGLNGVPCSYRVRKVTQSSASTSSVNPRKKVRQSQPRRSIHNRVVLERVLGITTSNSSGLACEPNSGLVAYPAGCVVVILHPKKNKQAHILNTSRKTFTALAFSQDGKYLVTGESGHMPCVRVWDVAERAQVASEQCHKYGVACVAFSTNGSYIVSVGYQHDMTVSVWEWRKGTVIASNKVSSRVVSVSFSEDSSYFVTAGNRHVKFWYLDASKERRVNSTVPLIGRSGILGEQRNSMFCDLACGRGSMASSTYCITSSGLLCQFNSRRLLDAWVDLKTSSARCLYVSERYIFCGCANGIVRVFDPQNLHYITTLHRPHYLGVDIAKGVQSGHLFSSNPDAEYPDTIALNFDPVTSYLTCVYNDHSVYVWDVGDIRNVGKVYSALYHSACVWSVETYPHVEDVSKAALNPGSFLTCSSDNTIRLWDIDPEHNPGQSAGYGHNLYSHDLMKIVYMGNNIQHLQHEGERAESGNSDTKSGIRVLKISPDGQHMATGDRSGNLRIFGLEFLDELLKIEAHDSEVLCLEFSPAETGLHLLASASRDRLIHIFNMDKEYSLEQTVYDHSAAITAIKFTGDGPEVHMVSCGADKSIYFRTAENSSEGLTFSRSHHVVEKATLYDMDLDSTRSHTAIACQDRNIRVYDIKSGKMKRCFKGSLSEDGTLLKVQMDPSGTFLATSCSDKNISIFEYETGECVATLFGHSEIVTEMRFTQDCRHLITVSGDSCVFVWRVDSHMTTNMRKNLAEMRCRAGLHSTSVAECPPIRRQTYIRVPGVTAVEAEQEEEGVMGEDDQGSLKTPARNNSMQDCVDGQDPMFLQTNGKLPMWARRLGAVGTSAVGPTENVERGPYQPRGRWAEQSDPQAIRSVLETRSLQLPLSFGPQKPEEDENEEGDDDDSFFHPQSLDSLLEELEDEEEFEEENEDSEGQLLSRPQRPDFLSLSGSRDFYPPSLCSPETRDYILYPAISTALSEGEGEFDVREQYEREPGRRREGWGEDQLSPDSACCVGSAESQTSSQDPPQDDMDSLSQVSSTGSSGMGEEDENPETLLRQHFDTMSDNPLANEKFDTDLSKLQQPTDSIFLNPRLSISTRFLSRFQGRTNKPWLGLPFRTAESTSGASAAISEEPSSLLPDSPKAKVTSKLFSYETVAQSVTQEGNRNSGPHDPPARKQEDHGDPPARKPRRAQARSSLDMKIVKSRPPVKRSSSVMTRRSQQPVKSRKTIATFHWQGIMGEVPNRTELEEATSQTSAMTVQPSSDTSLQKLSRCGNEQTAAQPVPRPGRHSYMGTTASSRAKVSCTNALNDNLNSAPILEKFKMASSSVKASSTQDLTIHKDCKENFPLLPNLCTVANAVPSSTAPTSSASWTVPCTSVSQQPQSPPGNHSARASLHLDLSRPDNAMGQKLRRCTMDVACLPALTTPTEMRSLGKGGRSYIRSVEESLAPQAHARGQSLGTLRSDLATDGASTARGWSPDASPVRVSEEVEPPSLLLPRASSEPSSPGDCARPILPSEGAASDLVSLQSCKQIANELQQSVKTASAMYSKLCCMEGGPDQQAQMTILTKAFSVVLHELESVNAWGQGPAPKASCPSAEESPGRQLRDERTVALLEKYSEMLLLRIAERNMDCS